MGSDTAIRIRGLQFTYDKANEPTLKNIQLDIPKGKFTAVMGETGAGKTTLLMALNGLIPQFIEGDYKGTVSVIGHLTDEVPIQALVQKIGLVLQDPETQLFGLTVEEDVAFGPSNLGMPLQHIHNLVERCLSLVGLTGYEKRSTEFLSGGEKQRLAVAGIIAIGSEIIVLDEPTSELDPEGKEAIFRIAEELKVNKQMTIVMAEHESEKVLAYADHVIVIQDGRIQWQGDPQVLFADEERVHAYRLRPPGVAQMYWALKRSGCALGERCPRTVDDLYAWLKKTSIVDESGALAKRETEEVESRTASSTSRKAETKNTPPRANAVLQIENLHHVYHNGHEALKGIDATIYEGDYLAIVGQNGAGKSTFCKHLNKLLTPTRGRILFKGEDIANKETATLAQHIGYVFQNPDHQIFSPSVLEEVMYGLKIRGVSERERKDRAMDVLQFVGLDQYIDFHPFSLSKGLRQRLAVASILVLEPEVLIIDEPTTGQDWQGTQNMLSLIERLHDRGHAIVVITHDMSIVTDHAQRVFIMAEGQLLKDCRPNDAFQDEETLRRAKITPPQVIQLADRLHIGRYIASASALADHIVGRVRGRV